MTLLVILTDLNSAVGFFYGLDSSDFQFLLFFSEPLKTIQSTPTTTGTTVTFKFHSFFIYQVSFKYLFIFSFSFIFSSLFAGTSESTEK